MLSLNPESTLPFSTVIFLRDLGSFPILHISFSSVFEILQIRRSKMLDTPPNTQMTVCLSARRYRPRQRKHFIASYQPLLLSVISQSRQLRADRPYYLCRATSLSFMKWATPFIASSAELQCRGLQELDAPPILLSCLQS